MMRKLSIALLLCVLSLSLASHAQSNRNLISVAWDNYQPRVSFSMITMADDHVKSQLSSGLKKRFVVTVEARDGDRVIASRFYSCSITFDLWENTFLVAIGKHQASTPTVAKAVQLCLNTQSLRVGEAKHFKSRHGEEITFAVRAEFDPISKDQCQALVRPGSSSDLIAPVAINLVRREICAAGRTAQIESDLLRVPP